MAEPTSQRRRHPAHPPPIDRHNEPTVLFVTVCALDRNAVLANDAVHAALLDVWPQADHWRVGRYMIMPDPVHIFCVPGVHEPLSIKRWAAYWKHLFAKVQPALRGVWQRDGWDTQMRSREHYDEKLHYVKENPVRAGLVERSVDWPFQGVLNEIIW